MGTDAELVAGVLAGDREAFAGMYDRYADRLFDFCMSVLRDRQDAEDAVQDTFVLVAQRLGQLNDPERLRPWLYAVARSVALRRAKARKRIVPDTEVSDMPDPSAGPQREAEQAALRELVWSAAAGLSERDRALLDLHLRQGLDGAELGEAMGVTANNAYVMLTRLRDQVERSLGALLIARLGRKDCPDLAILLADWDGKFTPLMRKRVARHVDNCETCESRKRTMVSPLTLLAAVPMVAAPLYLRDRVLDNVQLVAYERPLKKPSTRPARLPMIAAAVTLLLTIGLAWIWERGGSVPGIPVALNLLPDTTSSAPPSTGTEPTSTTPPPSGPTTTTTRPGTTTTTPRTTTTTTTTTTPPPPPDTVAPVITKQQATPAAISTGPPCQTTTTIQATATDNVGVTSMTATWTHTNGKSDSPAMTLKGGVWSVTIGPFAAGRITVVTSASDAAGNRATGPRTFVSISDCIT